MTKSELMDKLCTLNVAISAKDVELGCRVIIDSMAERLVSKGRIEIRGFGSFSVPLVVGGARGTTVEVLIYEKIRLSGHWSEAIILALLQSVFIFTLAFIVQKSKVPRIQRWARLDLIGQSSGVVLSLLISALYNFGYVLLRCGYVLYRVCYVL
jgi:thiamine transport system permease protein